jgi:hypothetical protein
MQFITRFREIFISFIIVYCVVTSLLVAGCGDSQKKDVSAAVTYVKSLLERAGKDLPASMSFQSVIESGGTPVTYIANNAPSGDSVLKKFTIVMDKPSVPWSIVIKAGVGPREYIIEGYGENINAPLVVEKITIGTVKPK